MSPILHFVKIHFCARHHSTTQTASAVEHSLRRFGVQFAGDRGPVKDDIGGEDCRRHQSMSGEERPKYAEYLRERASMCVRLAKATTDATTQAALIGLSEELLAEAARLEK